MQDDSRSFASRFLLSLFIAFTVSTTRESTAATTATRGSAAPNSSDVYARLPLAFEANRGQTHPQVDFLARGSGYTLFLSRGEAVLALRRTKGLTTAVASGQESATRAVLRMQLHGARTQPSVIAGDELPGKANYFIGADPTRWHTGIPTYRSIAYQDVYPGVDLIYYGNQGRLEYDLIVKPGADPSAIELRLSGVQGLRLDALGDLVLRVGHHELRQRKPVAYQLWDGVRQEIPAAYRLDRGNVRFEIGAYDHRRPLTIDPVLFYSTHLGGSGQDIASDISVDASLSAYITGLTDSPDFPTTSGAFDVSSNGNFDVFVAKLNPTGSALIYSTYLGGSDYDLGTGIVAGAAGTAIVAGATFSADYPTTPGAYDVTHNGLWDAFVTKLDASGSALVYSTFIGGSGREGGQDAATDAAGNVYVTGDTSSTNFPVTVGAFDTAYNGGNSDAFVVKLASTGAALAYATYLGGFGFDEGTSVAVDAAGRAHVTGRAGPFPTTPGAFDTTFNASQTFDAFVTKLDTTGAALVYSTYLGGENWDEGTGIALDLAGLAYVTGRTESDDFPRTAGAFGTSYNGGSDAFVTKLNVTGSALVYSTYLGGTDFEGASAIAVDLSDNARVTGLTYSGDLPTTVGAVDRVFDGHNDAFMMRLNASGSALVHSTYLGGIGGDNGRGIAVDPSGDTYVVGYTESEHFPTTPGSFDPTFNGGGTDAFVLKIAESVFVGPPATVVLEPATGINPVGTEHCVLATVEDASGNAVSNLTVRFMVTGAVTTEGSDTTDPSGQATFCYVGPPLPGTDLIRAYADVDNDGTQDIDEPSGTAQKTWVFPTTTPACEIEIRDNGMIRAANGDVAKFRGKASAAADGQTAGEQVYEDRGPVQAMTVESLNVLAIVCEGTTRASIYGQATINGAGSYDYRITVQDLGEPGRHLDTYGIVLETGYSSGEQTLENGNVQIRR
jgi:beta-propeller repeat-containing protein